ncbi:MAG: heme o synthase [Phycisphaerae bacterium]
MTLHSTMDSAEAGRLTSDTPELTRAPAVLHRPARPAAAAAQLALYYELTKPRMNFLVVVTTAVGLYMAGGLGQSPWLILATILGTALTAAGASVMNQYVERDLDGLMPRTARRPLPARQLPPAAALAFGVVLSVAGVAVLAGLVNLLTAGLGLLTLLLYVFVYTPAKRRTWWCTPIGAIPGAIPPVMGFTAAQNALSFEAAALFAILFFWQMPHFYGLAVMFRDDYAAGGYRMLPVVDAGGKRTGRQAVGFTLLLIAASLWPFALGMAGWLYLASAVVLGGYFLFYAVGLAREPSRPAARRLFFASLVYLPLLLAFMMLGRGM